MRIINFLRRKHSKVKEQPKTSYTDECKSESDNQDKYQIISLVNFVLRSRDYEVKEVDSGKKVTLCNVKQISEVENLTAYTVAASFRGSGHFQWEAIWATWLLGAVDMATKEEKDTADISKIFDHEYASNSGKVFTSEDVKKHLMPFFDIIEETEDELKVNLKVA